MIVGILLVLGAAWAAPPADLDGLVGIALGRDPEAAALGADAEAARIRASASSRLMDPQLMIGVESLGSKEEAEPTMGMFGATQMLRGWGEGRALSARLDLDAERADLDRERVAADLRASLWQSAARIGALQQELALLDEQLRSALALRDISFSRYAAGADLGDGMGGGDMGAMGGMTGGMEGMGVTPPVVVPRGGGAGGMAGMGGMGGSSGAAAPGPAVPQPAPAPPASATVSSGGSSGGLATLLRLDAEIARVDADRIALGHQLGGEVEVLALYVGEEAAGAVAAAPAGYFGAGAAAPPESRLAALDREAAEADVQIARTARRPDVMLSVAEMIMPHGMPMGTDISVGVEVPLWGAGGRELDAARAGIAAAEAREARVARDLAAAVAQGRAALTAAQARSASLEAVALPRARAAWDATLALFAAGQAREDDVVRAWETWIDIGREAVGARLDVQLRAAELARVEGL